MFYSENNAHNFRNREETAPTDVIEKKSSMKRLITIKSLEDTSLIEDQGVILILWFQWAETSCIYSITNRYSKEGSFACEDAHASYMTMSVTKFPQYEDGSDEVNFCWLREEYLLLVSRVH